MSVTTVWPFFLLILIPVIVLLYILKQKGIDEEVGSVMLWRETIKNTEATTPWERYRHNLLMYLQIATVLLLIFALASPYLKRGGRDYTQTIIVLDNSGSMHAAYDENKTRFEEAKSRALDYIDSLPENCAVSIISSVKGGEIIASNLSDKQAARRAVDRVVCTDLPGDLTDCKNLVASMCAQWDRYAVTMFSDSPVVLDDLTATVVNLYTEGENAAVNYLSYGYNGDGTMSALTKVSNYGHTDITRELNLYGDGELLMVSKVSVAAGESEIAYFNDFSFQGSLLTVEINESDSLQQDNIAGVVVDASSTKRILLVTGGNTFLEKALATIPGLDVYKTTDISVIGKNESFDLYIFDGVMPDRVPDEGNLIYWNPKDQDGEQNLEDIAVSDTKEGVQLSFVSSELSDYLEGRTFGVNQVELFNRPAWATSFLSCGEDCAGYYGENGMRRIICAGFDIHDTDLALSADFPIMIHNMINYALDNGMLTKAAYTTGDKVQISSRDKETDVIVTTPDGSQIELPATLTSKVFADVNIAGVYTVSQVVRGETVSDTFYAAFPVDSESDLTDSESVQGATVGSDDIPSGGTDLRNYVILVLLGLLITEWIFYVKDY